MASLTVVIACYVVIAFLCLSMIVEVLFITAIVWCKAFHMNLRILLTNLSFAYILISVANTGKFIWKTWDERAPWMFHNFSKFGSVVFLSTFIFILVERFYAIRYSEHYENCTLRYPWEMTLFCIMEWCISLVILFLSVDGYLGIKEMLIAAIAVECVCTVVFFFLYRWAKRIYNVQVETSLSNRYQQCENVRTTSSFWTALAYACISNIVITAGYYVISSILKKGVTKDICDFALIIIMISQPMVMIIQLSRCNPKLRKLPVKIWQCKTIKPSQPLSMRGDPLFLDISLHRDIYFKSYQRCWEMGNVRHQRNVL